ncbi:MAG: amidase family protein, partial [Candidatus Zixiibacteriota bacterium]
MIKEYHNLTAREIADGVKNRKFKAVDVCQTALERAFSAGKKLNAFITVTSDLALHQAEAIDDRIASGNPTGPLAGVPIAL